MKEFDALKMINNPALDAVRQLQENSALSAICELRSNITRRQANKTGDVKKRKFFTSPKVVEFSF